MTVTITEQAYEALSLTDDERLWEVEDGVLREKPLMGAEHTDLTFLLAHRLQPQLDRRRFKVKVDRVRVRFEGRIIYMPDVVVIPVEAEGRFRGQPGRLEFYDEPLPLVVEIWSPSTADFDAATKLPVYRARGDAEIWFVHPFARTLTAWRRQPDGSYAERSYRGGAVEVGSLPGVAIDLDEPFADLG